MKRRLQELDEILLESLPEEISAGPHGKALRNSLGRVALCEDELDRHILEEKRIHAPLHTSDHKDRKILRLFLRQTFHPQVDAERAHFSLTVEGLLLSPAQRHCERGFGGCLQSIRVQVDRRIGTVNNGYVNSQVFDWTEQQFPRGAQADVIQMKIPADKNCVGRIALGISNEASNQVRISNQLRACFENLTVETTEEEIYATLLQYVARNNLVDSSQQKDRKVSFRTDEVIFLLLSIMF